MTDFSKIELTSQTSARWVDIVESDFNTFLKDHAACERKASATGINFVVQYPDRIDLIDPMIHVAREELLHFQQVCRILKNRGVSLGSDERTPYVKSLLDLIRTGRNERFLDRLLTFGIIEARGTERFELLGNHLKDPELRLFYKKLAEAEVRHQQLFVDLALKYFSSDEVGSRLRYLLDEETKIMAALPLRAAVN